MVFRKNYQAEKKGKSMKQSDPKKKGGLEKNGSGGQRVNIKKKLNISKKITSELAEKASSKHVSDYENMKIRGKQHIEGNHWKKK